MCGSCCSVGAVPDWEERKAGQSLRSEEEGQLSRLGSECKWLQGELAVDEGVQYVLCSSLELSGAAVALSSFGWLPNGTTRVLRDAASTHGGSSEGSLWGGGCKTEIRRSGSA